jgi:peptide deformylase
MYLPIVGYGDPILRKEAQPITPDYPNLKQLIDDMFETMYTADGVGLAAPQIDLSIQLVVIGFRPYDEATDTYGPEEERHVLINPEILEERGEKQYFNEGCLSLPELHEDVLRPEKILLRWLDENFEEHTEEIGGMFARVAQHEIDHLHGKVFTDRLSPLRKTMIKRKLNNILEGKTHPKYRMKRSVKNNRP